VPQFDARQARVLTACVEQFGASLREDVGAKIREQMRGFVPAELREALEELDLVARQLSMKAPVEVHDIHCRMLKTLVQVSRRSLAAQIDEPRQMTTHREAIRFLESELRVLDSVIEMPWFTEATAAEVPQLGHYLSVRHAERTLGAEAGLGPRVLDEKFHILDAPTSFLPDLAHYRARCALRRATVTVAFLDIDDFKAFNSRYGETRVDRDVLPPLMELLEAHVFAHGHAYRFGGDEYVLLLPNMDRPWSVGFVERLQQRLSRLELPGIPERPTVSVGLCHVDPSCFLTDREVLERANQAKNRAKLEGKNRIALYRGELYRDEDIELTDS
jgi:diguanylate cyclase (GGDEF)-like protein